MKDEMLLNFDLPSVRDRVLRHVETRRGLHWFGIRKARNQKSLAQLGYYWGCIVPLIKESLFELWGERLDSIQVHEFLKDQLARAEAIIDRRTGKPMGIKRKSIAAYDTAEMAEYIDRVFRYAAEELELELPEAADYSGGAAGERVPGDSSRAVAQN